MTYRNPKTRDIIVSDLTPPHRNRKTGVHGAGTNSLLNSGDLDAYKDEQEEEIWLLKRIIKTLLRIHWGDIDWEDVDLEEIDWEEWE